MNIKLVQENLVVEINRRICTAEGNPFGILKPNAIASALHTAYYPGDYPFVHGGIASIAGAVSFYICQSHASQDGNKRTAAQTSLFLMKINSWDIVYPKKPNALASIIESCAKGAASIGELKKFYNAHKVKIQNN